MSMRHYGVETKALVLSDIEFAELVYKNRDTLDRDTFDLDLLEDVDGIDDLDCWDFLDYAYNIDYGTYLSEVNGQLILLDEDRQDNVRYFREDSICIFELKKDNLFEKYENIEEIYREYLERFRELGIKIDIPFIKEHFGKLECTYYG